MSARVKPSNITMTAHSKTDSAIACPKGDGGKLTVDADYGVWCPTGNHYVVPELLFVSNKQVRVDS